VAKYALNRFLQLILILFIANSLTFLLPRVASGEVLYQTEGGFNQPLVRQYFNYWQDLSHLDFGHARGEWSENVLDNILDALPWTLGFMTTATFLSFLLGTLVGAVLGWPNSPKFLQVVIPVLMSFSAVPFYYFALGVIWVFAIELRWFPAGGGFDPIIILGRNWETALSILQHAILPSLALMFWAIGTWSLTMRASMVIILSEDYLTFGRAKGLPEWVIFFKYGIRNALLPQVTNLSIQLGTIIGGSVLLETMFSYPGLGTLTFDAINSHNYPMINGCIFFLILCASVALYIVDIVYPLVDPRIKYS
jgi:peptide/nickel transport system permease protein